MYHEYFLGVKAAGAHSRQTRHFNLPTVFKYGSLNLLEPLEPVQACNWIALPLPFTEEKGYVASAVLRPHQIPDQRYSQFNDTKNFRRMVKLQTRRRKWQWRRGGGKYTSEV